MLDTSETTAKRRTDFDESPTARAEAVVNALAERRFDDVRPLFVDEQEGVPVDQLPESWEQLTSLFGRFEGITNVSHDSDEGVATVTFDLHSGEFDCRLTFDDGEITACEIEQGGGLSAYVRAARVLGRQYIGRAAERLGLRNTVRATAPEERRRVARKVIEHFEAERYDEIGALFSPELSSLLTDQELESAWNRCGAGFTSVTTVEYEPTDEDQPDGRAYVYFSADDGKQRLSVSFDADGRVCGVHFSPADAGKVSEYELPEYVDEAVTETDVDALGDELRAKFAVPPGSGPHPSVVLVHGSGLSDMDGTGGANRPYRDLALGLASRGVAVLRYDKRPRTLDPGFTVEDGTVADAATAVEWLRGHDETDGRIAVLGHSLGGYLAPRIVAETDAAGIGILAAPSRPLLDVLVRQAEFLVEHDEDDEEALAEFRESAARIRDGTAADDEYIEEWPASFWRDLEEYDPVEVASGLDARVLVCHADADWRVTDEDYERWRAGLDEDAHLQRYEDRTHSFFPSTGDPFEAGQEPSDVDSEVVYDVANWVTSLPQWPHNS